MGGRGRGGGNSTVRAVANALGIARHDMANFVQQPKTEAPPLFPPLTRALIPLEVPTTLQYMVDVKSDTLTIFHESAYYLDEKVEKDVKRYTDKYKEETRERLRPDFSRLPDELCWQKKSSEKQAKKRKVDDALTEIISEKLKRLEEADNAGEEEEEKEEESDNDSEKPNEEEPLSDDDYQEEDNDYATGYFDNGEGYGDGGGSDDNMDAPEY